MSEHIVNDEIQFDPEYTYRHAALTAGGGSYGAGYAEITRPEARALAALLLAYADTHDPGPGAHFPIEWPWWRPRPATAVPQTPRPDLGNGTLVPRVTRGIGTTRTPGSLGKVCPWCAGNGRVLGGACSHCDGVGYR